MITEKNIKKFIIILPLVGVLFTSIVLTNLFISQVHFQYEQEIKQLIVDEENNIKDVVKNRVNNTLTLLDKDYNQKLNTSKEEVRNTVDIAYNIIENTYNEYKNQDKNIILSKIKNRLKELRFYQNLTGYYFIYFDTGIFAMHPLLPYIEGKKTDEIKNHNLRYTINRLKNFTDKNNQGFFNWKWYKPNENTLKEKVGYLKKFKPLNIVIGSAKYKEDIQSNIKNKLKELLNIITFDQNAYIFAYDEDGNTISHTKKELLGKNRWNLTLGGRLMVQEIIKKSIKPKGAYIKYVASIDPTTNKSAEKTSYVRLSDKTRWAIGTGLYTSELFKNIKKKQEYMKQELDETIYKVMIYSFIITSFVLLVMFFIAKKVGDIFNRYKNHLFKVNNSLEMKVKDRTKELEASKNKLKEMALRDPLTNLYNRRYFEDVSAELISLSIRNDDSLCLLLIDIDKFKNVNDTYGHDIGDKVLKHLANTFIELLRDSDVITRVGGEEFAIVLPKTELQGAQKISEEIRQKIENENIEISEDSFINITISIGLTIFEKEIDKDVNSIFKKADIALYEAKRIGRNRVIVYNDFLSKE